MSLLAPNLFARSNQPLSLANAANITAHDLMYAFLSPPNLIRGMKKNRPSIPRIHFVPSHKQKYQTHAPHNWKTHNNALPSGVRPQNFPYLDAHTATHTHTRNATASLICRPPPNQRVTDNIIHSVHILGPMAAASTQNVRQHW